MYTLKSTPPGVPDAVPFAPGGLVEESLELGGGEAGEMNDGGELIPDEGSGVAGLSARGGVTGVCAVLDAAAARVGVVLSMI